MKENTFAFAIFSLFLIPNAISAQIAPMFCLFLWTIWAGAMKHNLYEGGIRVPTIIRWPEQIASGSRNSTPLISTDFDPTLLALTGCPLLTRQHVDGVSFDDVLLGKGDSVERDALYWHYPHNRHEAAVREGRYKLLHRFREDRVELYDLEADLGEREDLSEQQPKLAARLLGKLQQWQKSVGARFE